MSIMAVSVFGLTEKTLSLGRLGLASRTDVEGRNCNDVGNECYT